MDFWFWIFVAAAVLVGVGASGWWAFRAYRDGQFGRAWRWLRVLSLGGTTTLDRDLNHIACTICLESFDAGEKVRTLSCNHVFHRGGISKCKNGIDNWLRTEPRMICPSCFQTPHPVLPWKAPPPTPPLVSFLSETPPSVSFPSEMPPSSSGSYGPLFVDPLFPPLLSPPESSSGLDDPGRLFPPPLPPPRSLSSELSSELLQLDDREELLLPRSDTA